MLFRLADVSKSYGGKEILRDVSFQVNRDEKVGLVGRNGAGKTTLFRLLNEDEAPDAGEIHKAGDLTIGLLRQHVDFSPGETVHTAALGAFRQVRRIEEDMRRLEAVMAENGTAEVLEKYAALQTEFERQDGFSYAARAEAVLLGLGFEQPDWNLDTEKLSGGQKNRLGLVRLLLSKPDVLLLDEPTNHLDVRAVEWLEDFLRESVSSYVLISHDRYFLDKTCNKIIELENGRAYSYGGNYTDFLAARRLRREQHRREYQNQQAFIAKTEEFIRRNIAGQKTKQAKSRRNKLERMERIDTPVVEKPGGNFRTGNLTRAGTDVLRVVDLAVGFPEKTLAEDINFSLFRGECLGIIGGNGTGKTTLLKTLLGRHRELSGKILWGTKVITGYYAQELEGLEERNSVIDELRRVAPLAEAGELRSFLAGFLFFGEDVFKPVAALSGGEKGRLALAKLIYSNANVLILDEPTNHLDIASREALEQALESYQGTILTVSHDRYFLDRIATRILSFEDEEEGVVEIFDGNYTEFHDWKEKMRAGTGGRRPEAAAKSGREAAKTDSQKKAWAAGDGAKDTVRLSKNERRKRERRIRDIEREIPKLEEELTRIGFQMNSPAKAADHGELQHLAQEYRETEQTIQDLYDEWEHLLEELG